MKCMCRGGLKNIWLRCLLKNMQYSCMHLYGASLFSYISTCFRICVERESRLKKNNFPFIALHSSNQPPSPSFPISMTECSSKICRLGKKSIVVLQLPHDSIRQSNISSFAQLFSVFFQTKPEGQLHSH